MVRLSMNAVEYDMAPTYVRQTVRPGVCVCVCMGRKGARRVWASKQVAAMHKRKQGSYHEDDKAEPHSSWRIAYSDGSQGLRWHVPTQSKHGPSEDGARKETHTRAHVTPPRQ